MWISRRTYSGAELKLLAMLFMLIDHIGAIIIENGIFELPGAAEYPALIFLDSCLRLLGRSAFPLFCFLLSEGCVHTRSRRRYLCSLLIFAFLSEIPFDFAVTGKIWDPAQQNVFFTLAGGMAAIWLTDILRKPESDPFSRVTAAAGIIAVCVLVQLIRSDYGFFGVILAMLFYLLREKPREMFLSCGIWLCLGAALLNAFLYWDTYVSYISDYGMLQTAMVFVLSGVTELFGIFSFVFIAKYNGERGALPMPKYFFYGFYPVHFVILKLISMTIS